MRRLLRDYPFWVSFVLVIVTCYLAGMFFKHYGVPFIVALMFSVAWAAASVQVVYLISEELRDRGNVS